MDDALLDDVSNWRLCFWPIEKGQWWGRRFGHVSALGFSARTETWLHLDLHRSGIAFRLAYAHDDALALLGHLSDHAVLVKVPRKKPRRYLLRPFLCTSFVKHLVGCESRALSPDGLFRFLVGQGCEVLDARAQGERNPGAGGGA